MTIEGQIAVGLELMDGEANSEEAAIRALGELLERQGYIESAYTESVVLREKTFPTGIALPAYAIAIPHATPEGNVRKNGIAVLRPKHPVLFRGMENPEERVAARLVFMLALKESGEHIGMLQQLFGMFQEDAFMRRIAQVKDMKEMRSALIAQLKLN